MKNETKFGKVLTKNEMKKVQGGIGGGESCGTETCGKYQACCSRDGANGQTVYYCTTTACL
ncbi:bacteriocin [Dinghuibacter silviterrae]|uniref:Bacteriocin-like protein n=1 Tax=Dinghuibacter silviterrae TaxID=1539049 RepID=A0A4R8DIB7_9BACT|nr:bacteriocin [Dinghuibacter silviterrae]TDW97479.1 bacteriocin-like protein [Dinghuibacter silviterrae]